MTDEIVQSLRARAKPLRRGNKYEDFAVGQEFVHHWGRTLTEADNILFCTLTLHYNPRYFNLDVAKSEGHAGLVVCPLLVFTTVFGLSVEDLSEGGGPFLGVGKLTYHRAVLVGETVYGSSRVISARETKSRPDFGIVSWHTVGRDSAGETLIDFERSNLVKRRG